MEKDKLQDLDNAIRTELTLLTDCVYGLFDNLSTYQRNTIIGSFEASVNYAAEVTIRSLMTLEDKQTALDQLQRSVWLFAKKIMSEGE